MDLNNVNCQQTIDLDFGLIGGKVHGSLARAGKVKGQTPKVDKAEDKKKQRKNRLAEALDSMLARINAFLDNLQNEDGSIATELDKGLEALFNENIVREFRKRITSFVSQRGEKTYIFPCADKNYYLILVNDADRFRCEVVDKLRRHR